FTGCGRRLDRAVAPGHTGSREGEWKTAMDVNGKTDLNGSPAANAVTGSSAPGRKAPDVDIELPFLSLLVQDASAVEYDAPLTRAHGEGAEPETIARLE